MFKRKILKRENASYFPPETKFWEDGISGELKKAVEYIDSRDEKINKGYKLPESPFKEIARIGKNSGPHNK